jgi:hypothetical protein
MKKHLPVIGAVLLGALFAISPISKITSNPQRKFDASTGTQYEVSYSYNNYSNIMDMFTEDERAEAFAAIDATLMDGIDPVSEDSLIAAADAMEEPKEVINPTSVPTPAATPTPAPTPTATPKPSPNPTMAPTAAPVTTASKSTTTASRGSNTTAAKTEVLDWWNEARHAFPVGANAVVRDVYTGKTFRIQRTMGTNHADCEALTKEDTEIIKSIWGGFSWNVRPVHVLINGRVLAASMNAMPHAGIDSLPAYVVVDNRSGGFGRGQNLDVIKGNGMDGHFDIHFLNSTRHKDGQVDSRHQEAIRIAARH